MITATQSITVDDLPGLNCGLCGLRTAATVMLAVGVSLLVIATVEYARSARRQLAERRAAAG